MTQEKNANILFKGMTRPPMLFGVPIYPFITVMCIFAFVSVWTNPLYMLSCLPVFFVMKFIASHDDFIFNLFFQKIKMFTNASNKKYYGAKTYSTSRYRAMNSKVDFPPLSIMGLNRNPSLEKYIPYSSLVGEDIVLTKDFLLVGTWRVGGICFEVLEAFSQDFISKNLANSFQGFSTEPISFYFHSVRVDVDSKLKAKYDNTYLQDINDLYYKSFKSGSSKQVNLYITMVFNPFSKSIEKSKYLSSGLEKQKEELKSFIDKFEDYCYRLEANLSKIRVERLGIYEEDNAKFSSQLEFYNYLIGGRYLKVRALNAPINEYLTGGLRNIQFAGDLVQLNYVDNSPIKYGQTTELRETKKTKKTVNFSRR